MKSLLKTVLRRVSKTKAAPHIKKYPNGELAYSYDGKHWKLLKDGGEYPIRGINKTIAKIIK